MTIRLLSVHLELCEGSCQEVVRLGPGAALDQVRNHVVGGSEGGPEDEVPAAGEAGDPVEGHERGPADDGVAFCVHAAPSGTSGELRELARR